MQKKGRHLSVTLYTNLFKAATLSFKLFTSFTFFGGGHLYYGSNLVWVGLDTSLRHHEAQKFSHYYPEHTLTQIKLHVVGAKGAKRFFEIL